MVEILAYHLSIGHIFNTNLSGNLEGSITPIERFDLGALFKQIFNDSIILNKIQKTLTSYRVHSMII